MPTYEFWYSETYTNKGWFTAESLTDAKRLIGEVEDGELDINDLYEFGHKDKGYEFEATNITEVED